MFLWEVSWAPTSLDFDENTWHCHIQPASCWSILNLAATGWTLPLVPTTPPWNLLALFSQRWTSSLRKIWRYQRNVDAMNIVPFLVPESYTFYTAAFSDNWEALPVSPWNSKEGRCHRLRCCQQVTQLVNVKLNLSWAVSSPLWLEPQQLQYAL